MRGFTYIDGNMLSVEMMACMSNPPYKNGIVVLQALSIDNEGDGTMIEKLAGMVRNLKAE